MLDFAGFSHVIFDLDGVLLDTEPLYTKATEQVVAPFGKKFEWSLKRQLMGRDALSSAQHLVHSLQLPISAEEYLALKEPLLCAAFPDAAAMPGAEGLVRGLNQRGVPLAVATSSSSKHYHLKTSKHDWFRLFDAVVCSDHPRVTRLKPAPDIFLVAAAELGAAPGQCLVVEDSLAGVTAAHAAGMQVLALVDPNQDVEAFGAAQRVVQSYAELELGD